MSTVNDLFEKLKKNAQAKNGTVSTTSSPAPTFGIQSKPTEQKAEEKTQPDIAVQTKTSPPLVQTAEPTPPPTLPPVVTSPTLPPTPAPTIQVTVKSEVPSTPTTATVQPQTASSLLSGLQRSPLPQIEKKKFDYSPAVAGKGKNMMLFGKKGSGKTVLAFSVEGRIACISLDQQSEIIHQEFYHSDPRIIVFDGVRYYSTIDQVTKLETSKETMEYIAGLLDGPIRDFHPDWIVFDGTERLSHLCEMAMRASANIMPYEGVKNLNLWKMRNDFMNEFDRLATEIAKEGVIYTAYVDLKVVTTAQGEEKYECPKWAGDIEQKTRLVIKTEGETVRDGRIFSATVESSKIGLIPTAGKKIVGSVDKEGKVDCKGFKALIKVVQQ
jgi:hypothetical protein